MLILSSLSLSAAGLGIILSPPEAAMTPIQRSRPYDQAKRSGVLVRYAPWMIVIGGGCLVAAFALRET